MAKDLKQLSQSLQFIRRNIDERLRKKALKFNTRTFGQIK